jgi:hypothetical protein
VPTARVTPAAHYSKRVTVMVLYGVTR